MIKIIIILCENFHDAEIAYSCFIEWLLCNLTVNIVGQNHHILRVDTDDDLTYIFIDYAFSKVFTGKNAEFIDVEEFFEDMDKMLGYFG